MMEHTWVCLSIDFGAPIKRLIVNARSEIGRQFWNLFRVSSIRTDDAAAKAKLVEEFLVQRDPSLKGIICVGMTTVGFGRLAFDVVHPSFARSQPCMQPVEENLEHCPTCDKPLPLDGMQWVGQIEDRVTEFCCEACCKASERQLSESVTVKERR